MSKDSLYRILRTFLQSFITLFLFLATPLAAAAYDTVKNGGDFVFNLDVWQNIVLASLLSAGIAVFAALQNFLEDLSGKSILVPKKDPTVKQ